jgi:hypothetical protein
MALGDVNDYGLLTTVEALASATATNSAPTLSTDGIHVNLLRVNGRIPRTMSVNVYSTAGTGALSVTLRIWGYNPKAAADSATNAGWCPLGVGSAALKGVLNQGLDIDEDASISNAIGHTEALDLPAHFTRLYMEITAIAGTNTAVTVQYVIAGEDISN